MSADFAELAGHDAYDLLGVAPDATQDEIRRAFRALAKANHPDLFRDPQAKVEADTTIRLLTAARDVLQNHRADYDAFRTAPSEPDPEEIIDDPWADAGTGRAPPPHPWDTADLGPPPAHRPRPYGHPPRPRWLPQGRTLAARIRRGWAVAWRLVVVVTVGAWVLQQLFPDDGPQPAAAVPAQFAGTWAGTVQDAAKQDGTRVRWKAEVTLRAGKHNGEVRYLDGKCAGTAVPVFFAHDRLTLKTVFGSAMGGCDVGDMHLAPRKGGKLGVAYYAEKGKVTASGVLARR
ncbi:MAG: J domain-containing protein [Actinoallomurus sp.]